jgi:hypothetical protein
MEYLNPMLNQKKESKEAAEIKPRKTRIDKKYPVKIPLTLDQRIQLKRMAFASNTWPTPLTGELLKAYLIRSYDYPVVVYQTSKKYAEAKLEKEFYNILIQYSIEWDVSIKQAAHRIFTEILRVESEGL